MAEAIGALAVRIGADASKLVSELQRGNKSIDGFASKVETGVKALKGLAVALEVRQMAEFVKSVANAADEMGKLSEKVGVSIESLSGLKHAASLSDVSMEQLSVGLRQLAKNMSDMQAGTGEARTAFQAMGIQVTDSEGRLKSTEQMLRELADRFAGMQDGAGKTAIAMRIFGESGVQLIPVLNQGSKGLSEMQEEAARLGIVFSGEAAKSAEEFKENMTRLNAAAEGLGIQIGGPLVEAIGKASGAMLQAKKDGESWLRSLSEGLFTLFTGDDAHKLNVQIVEATDAYLEAQQSLDKAKQQRIGSEHPEFDDREVAKFTAMVKASKDELDQLLAKKELLFGGGLKGGDTEAPKVAAPALPSVSGQETDEQAAQRLQDQVDAEAQIMQEANDATVKFRDQQLEEEKAHQDARIEALADFADRYMDEVTGMNEDVLATTEDYGKELHDFQMKSYGDQAKTIFGELAGITAGVSQHNKKLFEINKIAGIGEAIVNAYIGISKTLSAYPYPLNIAMAAAHAAAAFAQVAAIRSASFEGGGGGSAPSVAGSTAAPPVSDVGRDGQGGGQQTVIHIEGQSVSKDQVKALFEQINEGVRDGGKFVIA